ncbi:hypothetical protein [Candidatus Magnetominusculus dajiuhuensis]|uniref:hypothetical protein n=1 Tax=Candidatus Magnetominusculus dajiuhuensis TaxID=3137712 RepID=UPI003B4388D9
MKGIALVLTLIVLCGVAFAEGDFAGRAGSGALHPAEATQNGWYCGLLKSCDWYSVPATSTNSSTERMLCTFLDNSTNDIYLSGGTLKYTVYTAAITTGHYLCTYYDTTQSLFTQVLLSNHN